MPEPLIAEILPPVTALNQEPDAISRALVNVSDLPIDNARLPAAYRAAVNALSTCASIDECKNWADKAAALRSYARQADDDALEKQAIRIRDRAIRRCGELLLQFDGRGRPSENSGYSPTISQREAAADAGMSKDQQVTAVRVAKVPAEQFEQAVESADPPNVTRLADWGRKPSEVPEWFQEAPVHPSYGDVVKLGGHVRRLAEFCVSKAPAPIIEAIEDHQRRELRANVAKVRRWLKQFAAEMRS